MSETLPEEVWNEASLTNEQVRDLQRGLPYLIAFNKDHGPKAIGTAFVVTADGSTAVACTAAHNFDGIQRAQNPKLRAHATTPREFTAMQPLDLEPRAVRAAVVDGDVPDMAELTWVLRDEATDLAFFGLKSQSHMPGYFTRLFPFDSTVPAVGEVVCALGFRDSIASFEPESNGSEKGQFQLRRHLVLRRGRVIEHHERHIGCRGPCVEVTIPTFPGMSGGPVFALPKEGEAIRPFGVISADHDVDAEARMDRSKSGATLVALPSLNIAPRGDGVQDVTISLPPSALVSKRSE